VSLSVLAGIFLLQAASEWTHDEMLTDVAYRVLGQQLEAWAGDVFLVWCIVVLLEDSEGWTRRVGVGAVTVVVVMRAYAHYLAFQGRSLSVEAPALLSLALLPFVWLIFEAIKRSPSSHRAAEA
jgi:cell shape-determining protein MreD